MSSGALNEPIADRESIHKSCRSLEAVVNVLNDYCEAANAILTLQRKLVKALRDAAAAKCVPEIPANALNVSATIFDTLCEVDAKFVKLADKECDAVSAEVKKWFKKLAKEERAYDDRLANANAKLKQAGQLYEKKAKKNPQDAADEHARYMNILTTLGPEINQEKYNHSLMVTRRHHSTIHSLAASLSRVADAEWLRSCEGVRRSAPTIGQLGEWRVYCEGGWSGPLPADLPNGEAPDRPDRSVTPIAQGRAVTPSMEKSPQGPSTPMLEKPAPEYSSRRPSEQETDASSRAVTPSHDSSPAPPQYHPAKTIADDSVRSLASLSSFPSPPTHFPMPPLAKTEASPPVKETRPESPRGPRTPSEILFQRRTESPIPLAPSETSRPLPSPAAQRAEPAAIATSVPVETNGKAVDGNATQQGSDSQHSIAPESPESRESHERHEAKTPSPVLTRAASKKIKFESAAVSSGPTSSISGSSQGGDHVDDGEFGALRPREEKRPRQGGPVDAQTSQPIERSDTGMSNGSVVAALRDRYSRIPEQPTSPRKEVPRSPTSVSKIANKYEPIDAAPTSPRLPPPTSPAADRRRLSMDISRNSTQPFPTDRRTAGVTSTSYATNTMASIPMHDDIAIRRQRIAELEELELREQELELRRKEREIGQRAKALEEERARIFNARSPDSGYGSDAARSGMTDRLSMSQQSDAYSTSSARPRYTPHSYSSAALEPPRATRPSSGPQPSSQSGSPLYQPASDHAPYCGCETCSASKYASQDTSPSPIHVRPVQAPLQLRPEKPKGWIRRLSMPVMGNAFSLDSKKGISSAGIAGGPGMRSSLALPEEDGMIRRDVTGGVRNRSATNLARR